MGLNETKGVGSALISSEPPPPPVRLDPLPLDVRDLVEEDQRPQLTYTAASSFINSCSVMSDPPHRKLYNAVDLLHRRIFPEVSKCWQSFKDAQRTYTTALGGDLQATALMSPASTSFTEKVSVSEQAARIAFFGPTGSGKSYLINTLLSMEGKHSELLPIGEIHTTARVCVLKYTPLVNACVSSWEIVDGGFKKTKLEDLSMHTTLSGVILKHYLARGSMSEAQEKWLTTVIVIEYPIPLLEAGLEVVDLAGAASRDTYGRIVFPFIKSFLSLYRPHGIVFCFNKAGAIEAGEDHAFKQMQELITGLAYRNGDLPDFFFANTKADMSTIKRAWKRTKEDPPLSKGDIEQYNQECLGRLRTTASSQFDLPAKFQECTSFCCVSATDFVENSEEESQFTFGLFINRFVHWVVVGQLRRCQLGLQQISSACGCFFFNFHHIQAYTEEEIRRKAAELDQKLVESKESLKAGIMARVTSFPEHLKKKLKEVKEEYLSYAEQITTQYDNHTLSECRSKAESAIIEDLIGWINENVTIPVGIEIDSEIRASVDECTKKFNNLEDGLMRDFFNQARKRDFFSKDNMIYIGGAMMLAGFATIFLVVLGPPLLLTGLITATASQIYSRTKRVNGEFKRELAANILTSLIKTVTWKQWLQERLNSVEQLFEGYRTTLHQQAVQKNLMRRCVSESTVDQWRALHRAFGNIIADTWLTGNIIDSKTPPQVDFSPGFQIGRGCCSSVYKAEWCGQQVAIKVMDPEASIEDDQRGFEEVFYSTTLVASHSSRDVLKFLLLFKQENKLCLTYPLLSCSLGVYLAKNIAQLSLPNILHYARHIIHGIKHIHSRGLIHRDIKLENILVKIEGEKIAQVVVADFSVVDATTPSPVLGTTVDHLGYFAPEVVAHKPFTNSIDIFAFGIMLAEMIPKPELIRLRANEDIHSLIPSGTQAQLVDLIMKCVDTDPARRPTARTTFTQLKNMAHGH
ncbi:Serine/threonine-protein kinase STY46 [Pelomyxa schiedti]|nr:Serine/threonine-protein kinase STY46 [Pelomyxa schiedti]